MNKRHGLRKLCFATLPMTTFGFMAGWAALISPSQAHGQSMSFEEIGTVLKANPPATGDLLQRDSAILNLDEYLKNYESTRQTRADVADFYKRMISNVRFELRWPVVTGSRIWKMYNHGFIVKTPSSVFAFDLIDGWSNNYFFQEELLQQIDALFVSHSHGDHSDTLVQKMVRNFGGDVFKTSNISAGTTVNADGFQVTAYNGLHSVTNYIFTVTTSEGLTIMHTGDTQTSRVLPDNVNPDIFLVNAWMNESGSRPATVGVRNAVRKVAPALTIPGHIQELNHAYNPASVKTRVPYAWPLAVDDEPIPGNLSVMAWGERYDYNVGPIEPSYTGELLLSTHAVFSTKDNDSDLTFDGLGDSSRNEIRRKETVVGENDTESNNDVVRLISQFALPEFGAAERLISAKLGFYLEEIAGEPSGPVSIFHSVQDNSSVPAAEDFEDATYLDTQLDLVHPNDPVGIYYELDVTDQVLMDYHTDGFNAISSFRLQVNEADFVDDDLSHGYQFTLPGRGTNSPRLILVFVPEPSALVLLIGGLLILQTCAKRQG